MYFLCKNEYRIFKPVEITIRRNEGRKEKNGGDEPIRDTDVYIYGNVIMKVLVKLF
jgi:hypothetical protein